MAHSCTTENGAKISVLFHKLDILCRFQSLPLCTVCVSESDPFYIDKRGQFCSRILYIFRFLSNFIPKNSYSPCISQRFRIMSSYWLTVLHFIHNWLSNVAHGRTLRCCSCCLGPFAHNKYYLEMQKFAAGRPKCKHRWGFLVKGAPPPSSSMFVGLMGYIICWFLNNIAQLFSMPKIIA